MATHHDLLHPCRVPYRSVLYRQPLASTVPLRQLTDLPFLRRRRRRVAMMTMTMTTPKPPPPPRRSSSSMLLASTSFSSRCVILLSVIAVLLLRFDVEPPAAAAFTTTPSTMVTTRLGTPRGSSSYYFVVSTAKSPSFHSPRRTSSWSRRTQGPREESAWQNSNSALFLSDPGSSPSSRLQERKKGTTTTLTDYQKDCVRSYLNKHQSELLQTLALLFTSVGADIAKANVWSGGSMELVDSKVEAITETSIQLAVTTKRRDRVEPAVESVNLELDADPIPQKSRQYPSQPRVPTDSSERNALNDWCRRMARLCWIAKRPEVTGKLVQLALQLHKDEEKDKSAHKVGLLPPNLYLNQVPHNRYVRQYFYDQASDAVLEAVLQCSQGHLTNRMQVLVQFPELNPSMDSYRIGTLLEMVRAIAIRLAEENVRVRVCVQQSMGVGIFTGLPKQLGGVAKLLQLMDWQSNVGEINEGMVGNYVNFGGVGPDHVQNTVKVGDDIVQAGDDVFLLVAPQSMVGTDSSIVPLLKGMVDAAGDRPVILINPDLTDKVSSAGQQSVRGRQERIDFANSFHTIHCFQNIYVSGTSYFPILGAMTKQRHNDPWVAHQRRDLATNDGGEMYVPVLMSETRPDGQSILESFER